MPLHREMRIILLPNRNYNETFEPFYIINDIKPLIKYSWTINNQHYILNSNDEILRYEIQIETITLYGQINWLGFMASETQYQSQHSISSKRKNGISILLVRDTQYNLYWNEEFWDEKEIEI